MKTLRRLLGIRPRNRRGKRFIRLFIINGGWMCPLQDDDDRLENTPADHKRAIEFDAALREKDSGVFIHRSLKPYSEVVLKASGERNDPCDSGLCML